MGAVTLQGPVVVLPAAEYQKLLSRLTESENTVHRLVQFIEDLEDIHVMHEAEAEYNAGDTIPFSDLLSDVLAEND